MMDYKIKLVNLEAWIPQEYETALFLKEFLDHYVSTLSMCGDGEEADDALSLYKKALFCDNLNDIRNDIQEFFVDCYNAVGGEIDEYYAKDVDLLYLIRLALGLER